MTIHKDGDIVSLQMNERELDELLAGISDNRKLKGLQTIIEEYHFTHTAK